MNARRKNHIRSDVATLFPQPGSGSRRDKGEHLANLVSREKAILILDGMEPLQDRLKGIKDAALARLIECLAKRNAGICVITTRAPIRELQDFRLTVQEANLEQLSIEAGRALLRIKGIRGGDADLKEATVAFDNHAFAIKLLASYLKRFERGDVRQAVAIPDLPKVTVGDGKHPRRIMAAFAKRFGAGPELELLSIVGLSDRPLLMRWPNTVIGEAA